jgi:hypothetical protein
MPTLFTPPFLDVGAGITPADGALLNFYIVGSGTRKDTYLTAAAGPGTEHANPVVADALGVFAAIYVSGDYEWVLTDKNGVQTNTGLFSEFAAASSSAFVKNLLTLAIAAANSSLIDGDALNIEERTSGNGGGAMWDVALLSTGAANAINRVVWDHNTGAATDLVLVLRVQNGRYIAEDWGIVGDGVTDNSVSQQAIVDAAGEDGLVEYGKGVFRGHFSTSASLKGRGPRETIFQAVTAGTAIITLTGVTSANLWSYRSLTDFEVWGDINNDATPNSEGITFLDSAAPPDQINGRWVIEKVMFNRCTKGFAKTMGNIGNTFNNCNFHQCVSGYWAKDVDEGLEMIMQGSNDDFNKCHFQSNTNTGVYINSDSWISGQTSFNDCVFENELGMAVFIKAFKTSWTPLVFQNCWWEGNARTGSVTIDTIAYVPQDLFVAECPMAILKSCNAAAITAATRGNIVLEKCFLHELTEITKINQESSVIALNCYGGGTKATQLYTEGSTGFTRDTGAQADVLLTNPRTLISDTAAGSPNLILSQDFANAESYQWSGDSNPIGRSAPDGVLFDSCCEVTVATGNTDYITSGTMTAGNYIVWTIDVKNTTVETGTLAVRGGDVIAANGLELFLTRNEWTSLAGLAQVTTGAGGIVKLQIVNETGVDVTYRLSAFQFVEFIDIQDAITFYRSGIFLTDARPRVFYSNAMPTTGSWVAGAFAENTASASYTPDGNNMLLTGWRRATTSSNNVLGTDWFAVYLSTVTPAT